MKKLLSLFFVLGVHTAIAQVNEIYHLTFSDPTNFALTNHLGHRMPQKFYIVDTTASWSIERFWLQTPVNWLQDKNFPETTAEQQPSNPVIYLFRDSLLNQLFTDADKRALGEQCSRVRSGRIKVKGENYTTVSRLDDLKGFYFITTKPVFSPDKNYAFIDVVAYYKMNTYLEPDSSCFGSVCIVYQKQPDNTWKKIRQVDQLAL